MGRGVSDGVIGSRHRSDRNGQAVRHSQTPPPSTTTCGTKLAPVGQPRADTMRGRRADLDYGDGWRRLHRFADDTTCTRWTGFRQICDDGDADATIPSCRATRSKSNDLPRLRLARIRHHPGSGAHSRAGHERHVQGLRTGWGSQRGQGVPEGRLTMLVGVNALCGPFGEIPLLFDDALPQVII